MAIPNVAEAMAVEVEVSYVTIMKTSDKVVVKAKSPHVVIVEVGREEAAEVLSFDVNHKCY